MYCSIGILVALAIFLAGLPNQQALAQVPTPSDDEVNLIAHELYCPVCENTPLDVCPTEACRQWRELIRQQLSEGWSKARIQQYFVEQYGARVLAEPPRTGLNWLIYLIPPATILAGALLLLRALRVWTRRSDSASSTDANRAVETPGSEPRTDAYVSRIEDELKKRG